MRVRFDLMRGALFISGLTLLSRITGLIRDTLVARIFGVNVYTDAFNVAFRLPNLLRRLSAEGAFSQAFVPILAEFKQRFGKTEIQLWLHATATVLTWVLVLISVIGMIGASFLVWVAAAGLQQDVQAFSSAIWMTRLMFPYIVLISLSTLAAGILNSYQRFSLPAFSPVMLNLSMIIGICVAPYFKVPIHVLAVAVMVGGILQLLILLPALSKIHMLPKITFNPLKAFAHPGVKRLFTQMMPAVFSVSVAQLSLVINTHIASRLTPGSVSWLTYADRLMEFPSALLGVALGTILLPNLSKAYVQKDHQEYSALLDWGLRWTLLLTVPCAVGLLVYAQPLVAVLYHYGHFTAMDVSKVSVALRAYGMGLIGLILIKILAPGFYARHNIKTPVKIAIVIVCLTQLANMLLVPYFAHAGLSLSISIGACLNAIFLFIGLRKKHIYVPLPGWKNFFVQLCMASLAMTLMLLWFLQRFDWIALGQQPLQRIEVLAGTLLASASVYFFSLWATGFRYRLTSTR